MKADWLDKTFWIETKVVASPKHTMTASNVHMVACGGCGNMQTSLKSNALLPTAVTAAASALFGLTKVAAAAAVEAAAAAVEAAVEAAVVTPATAGAALTATGEAAAREEIAAAAGVGRFTGVPLALAGRTGNTG